MTASSIAWTPLFLNAVPHSAGMISHFSVRSRIPKMISSSESSPSLRYLSISSSDASAAASTMNARAVVHSSSRFAGISAYSNFVPLDSMSHTIDFILMRSITPSKPSSAPIGTCSGTG